MTSMILIVSLVFSAILGVIAYFILNRREESRRYARTMSVIRGQVVVDGGKSEKEIQDKRRADIARKLKENGEAIEKEKKKDGLKQKLVQAGLSMSVKKFWIYSILFAIFMVALMVLSGQKPHIILLVGFTALFGFPRFVLKKKIQRRQKKFLEDFADALEAMVRLLKAGMPVSEAIAMASREFTGPIGEEMARIYDAQKIGVSLQEAVLEASRRMPITEMQMFATGISIQAQTGSSLSEVLTNLARVIRSRFRLKRKVQALSAEAKASAMIIGSLPFLIGGGMYLINGDYIMMLFNRPLGQAWLIGSAVWMTIGVLVMRAMINFKI